MTVRPLAASLAAALLIAGGADADPPRVRITSPNGSEAVAGELTVTVAVASDDPVTKVVLRVDGREVGSDVAPPYEFKVDLGYENVEHRFEAVAVTDIGASARATLTTPRIKVDEEVTVELQQLYVTATSGSERVLGLDRDDFTILDNGKRQRVITFERGEVPFTAAILIDASSSMAGVKLRSALDGAQAFAQSMQQLDEAKLVAFSDRPLASTPFLGGGVTLSSDLLSLTATGGTALNDQLFLALHELEQRQGRRVAIILSDGLDSHSVLSIDDLQPLVDHGRTLLYWVRLVAGGVTSPDFDPGREHSAWRDGKAHKRQIDQLERAIERSGGRIALVRNIDEIQPTFTEILSELRDQYVLGYYPSSIRNDGSWHDVEVKVPFRSRLGGVSVRTSAGYLDL